MLFVRYFNEKHSLLFLFYPQDNLQGYKTQNKFLNKEILELSALRRNAEAREREWQAKVRLTHHVLILVMSKAVFQSAVVNLHRDHNCGRGMEQLECIQCDRLRNQVPPKHRPYGLVLLNGFLKEVIDFKIVLMNGTFP